MSAKKKATNPIDPAVVAARAAMQRAEMLENDTRRMNDAAGTANTYATLIEEHANTLADFLLEAPANDTPSSEWQQRLRVLVKHVRNLLVGYMEAQERAYWYAKIADIAAPSITLFDTEWYVAKLKHARGFYIGDAAKPFAPQTWYRAADRTTWIITEIHDKDYMGDALPAHKWTYTGLSWQVVEDGSIRQGSFSGHTPAYLAGFVQQS